MPNAPKWVLDIAEKILMPKLPSMEVINEEFLSPSVKKIRFRGDFTSQSFHPGSYMDIRVSDTEVRRYTAAFVDVEKNIMDFIVHLHGSHPGSLYMEGLAVGDKINAGMVKPHKYYNETVQRYVVFGDETSLALAYSLFCVFRDRRNQFEFYFELEEKNRDVPGLLGLQNYTVFPKNGSFRNEHWISGLSVFESQEWKNTSFIMTGNAKSVQSLRKVAKSRTSAKITAHGYWMEGRKGL